VTYEAQDEAAEDAMMAEAQKRIGSLSLTF
jgi:hypothetical protein